MRRRSPASANETSRPNSLRALEGTSRESCIEVALRVARTPSAVQQGCSLTLQIVREILARDTSPANRHLTEIDDRVLTVLSIVETEWTNHLKVSDLACRVNLSPSRLSHLFKKNLGVSVLQFVRSIRLVRSISALRDSDERISQVCYQSGMNSHSAFDRSFKRIFGCSPKTFREIQKREEQNAALTSFKIAGSVKT